MAGGVRLNTVALLALVFTVVQTISEEKPFRISGPSISGPKKEKDPSSPRSKLNQRSPNRYHVFRQLPRHVSRHDYRQDVSRQDVSRQDVPRDSRRLARGCSALLERCWSNANCCNFEHVCVLVTEKVRGFHNQAYRCFPVNTNPPRNTE